MSSLRMTDDVTAFDMLLTNATVLTADAAAPVLRGATIGIDGGRIVWIGGPAPENATAKRTIDLTGHIVTPGFVNSHLHSALTMVRGVAFDVGFAPSYTPGIPNGASLNPDQARAMARLGALEAMLFGSTLLGDNFVHADATTEALAEFGLRLCPSWRIHDVDFARVAAGEWSHDARIGARSLGAAMDLHEKWKGHPRISVNLAAHAVDTCSNELLCEIATLAGRHGLRINTHLSQSQAEVDRVRERTGKTSTEVLEDVGLLNDRLLGGHCIYLSDTDIGRIADAGAHVVQIPKPNAASGRLAPMHKIKQAGINIAIATDTQHGDMIEIMRWALMTGRVRQSGVSQDWQPRHAFEMATINGARALGLDREIGSIEVGKQADLVVIDARRPHMVPMIDPLGNLVHSAQGRDVSMVMVAGEILVEDSMPTRVDAERICREAESVARDLWGAVGRHYWRN
jgi:5-methylthioadenosine/S-adenosylhomocysteine deaminase